MSKWSGTYPAIPRVQHQQHSQIQTGLTDSSQLIGTGTLESQLRDGGSQGPSKAKPRCDSAK